MASLVIEIGPVPICPANVVHLASTILAAAPDKSLPVSGFEPSPLGRLTGRLRVTDGARGAGGAAAGGGLPRGDVHRSGRHGAPGLHRARAARHARPRHTGGGAENTDAQKVGARRGGWAGATAQRWCSVEEIGAVMGSLWEPGPLRWI